MKRENVLGDYMMYHLAGYIFCFTQHVLCSAQPSGGVRSLS